MVAILRLLLPSLLLITALTGRLHAAETLPWTELVPVVSNSTIRYERADDRRTSPLSLNLSTIQELHFISWLRPGTEATPYLLLSGTPKDGGDRSLFVIRADGKLNPQRVTFPGKVLDPKKRTVIHESRAFYGRCLSDQRHDALVLYQRDRVDKRNRLNKSIYVAEASPNLLTERLIERRLPSIKSIQLRVRSRQCSEISGRNRLFRTDFFRFRNRGGDATDKDKEEDEDREDEASVQKALVETG